MSEKLPKATHQGKLTIGDKEIDCAVLEDGTRLITQTSFLKALGRSAKPFAGSGASFEKIPAFLAPKNLKPFISKDLELSMKPIVFKALMGGYHGKGYGYKAETLPMVCGVYLDAGNEGKLLSSQKHMEDAAKVIIRGLATVGIIALVDEATGYQEVRDKMALQEILSKYISKELMKWQKRFPDEYYEKLFTLLNIQYKPLPKKKPWKIGRITKDIIYDRLEVGVLRELERKNPKTPGGGRKHKHHQWLTEDVGHPKLAEQISNVITLMKASANWGIFQRLINRALPKKGDTFMLPMEFEDERE